MSGRWITVAGRHILVRSKVPEDYNDPDEEYLDKWDEDNRGYGGGSDEDDKVVSSDYKKLNKIFNGKKLNDEDLRHLDNSIEIELKKNISEDDKRKLKALLKQVREERFGNGKR